MPKVDSKKFFQEQSAHSRVKADLIFKYVTAWAKIVLFASRKAGKPERAAYIDLFSGPGSYEDGSRSTPLLIIENVLQSKISRDALQTFFNDENEAFITSLKQEIDLIPDVSLLGHASTYRSETASVGLFESFALPTSMPVFVFLDQFGYSEVTSDLIRRIFRHQKCDCAFFFRTSRVIAAVNNSKVIGTLGRLFGRGMLQELRQSFERDKSHREEVVLGALQRVMFHAGAKHFLSFPFRIHEKNSSRHHLIYLGKHELGLGLMKEIMGKASSRHVFGVPVLGYSDVPSNPTLFEIDLIPGLQSELLAAFAGKHLTVAQVYTSHHPRSTQFVLRNYQEALRRLEAEGKISALPAVHRRPTRNGKVTMSESVVIDFPRSGSA
jgi:three-Cys-motif partner protein